jgi:hypothetical protein
MGALSRLPIEVLAVVIERPLLAAWVIAPNLYRGKHLLESSSSIVLTDENK